MAERLRSELNSKMGLDDAALLLKAELEKAQAEHQAKREALVLQAQHLADELVAIGSRLQKVNQYLNARKP